MIGTDDLPFTLRTACAKVGGEHPVDGEEAYVACGHGERLKHA